MQVKLFYYLLLSFSLGINVISFSMEIPQGEEHPSTRTASVKRARDDEEDDKPNKRARGNNEQITQEVDMQDNSAKNLPCNLPFEIWLIIFEVDFYGILEQEITLNDVESINKSKELLSESINNLNKFLSINSVLRAQLLDWAYRRYIPLLVKKFTPESFFEIVRLPKVLKDFFKYLMQNKNVAGLEFDQFQNGLANNGINHLANGCGIYGFICRIGCSPEELADFCKTNSNCTDIFGMIHASEGNKDCLSMLMWAAFVGNKEMVQYLLDNSEVNTACKPMKSKQVANDYLERYPSINALSLAKTKEIVQMLIDSGASCENLCLEMVLKHADCDAVQHLFENYIKHREGEKIFSARIKRPFVSASNFGRLDLLKSYFFENYEFDRSKIEKAIRFAAKKNHLETVQYLISKHRNTEEDNREEIDLTENRLDLAKAFVYAARNGNYKMLVCLLSWPMLQIDHETRGKAHEAMMEAIVKSKNIKEKDNDYEKIVKLLVANGVDATLPEIYLPHEGEMGELHPITQTNNPSLLTFLFVAKMKKNNLEDKDILKLLKEELGNFNNKE